MAKDRHVATATGVAEEVESPETTAPETTEAPAPVETPAETTEEPAAAAYTTLRDLMSLIYDTPEAKRVLDQINGLAKLSGSFRSSIHAMISAENKLNSMGPGQQMFFISLAQGTWDIQTLLRTAEGIMMGQVLVDPEGEVVTDDRPNPTVE